MRKIFLIFIFLFLINLVVAQPPFQQSEFVEGQLIIETSYPEVHKPWEDYYIHVHVYNGSTGLLVKDGISCRYHFYNHQMKGGEHISIGNLHSYGDGFYANVTGTLLNTTGQYSVLSWCNSSSEGGFFKYTFDVVPGGFTNTIAFFFLILILSVGIVMFGFQMQDPIVTLLGSFGLYFLALWILFNGIVGIKDLVTTWALGIITLGMAFYFSIRSAHEIITGE